MLEQGIAKIEHISHFVIKKKINYRLGADIGKGGTREFTGLTDCLVKVFKSDGIIGLYRGFNVSVQGIIIYRATYFGLYDTIKATYIPDKNNQSLLVNFLVAEVILTILLN